MKSQTVKGNKTLNDLKVEIESIKNTQTLGNVEMKNLGTWTGTSEVSLTNKIQVMEDRFLGLEETIEEMDISIKENVKSKTHMAQKTSRKSGMLWKDQIWK